MKKQENITKACGRTVGASIARPFFEEITKNNIKNAKRYNPNSSRNNKTRAYRLK